MSVVPRKIISPQSESIYQLLLRSNSLTAQEIGRRLDIFPHAVYRAVKPLISLGWVEKNYTYPVSFRAKPIKSAIDQFLFNERAYLLERFLPSGNREKIGESPILDISFIENRQDFIEKSNEDMKKAKHEVDLIVSGFEVPAETILENKRAIERGVTIKTLVQRKEIRDGSMLDNWRKMGIEVRFCHFIEARLIIFDAQIAYAVSYDPTKKESGVGVRFAYAPIARLMKELFDQRWKTAVTE